MHSRWVAVYNANLDRSSALRKRPAELRAEMRRWEEEQRQRLRKEPLKTDIAEYRVSAGLVVSPCIIIIMFAVACKQSRV